MTLWIEKFPEKSSRLRWLIVEYIINLLLVLELVKVTKIISDTDIKRHDVMWNLFVVEYMENLKD